MASTTVGSFSLIFSSFCFIVSFLFLGVARRGAVLCDAAGYRLPPFEVAPARATAETADAPPRTPSRRSGDSRVPVPTKDTREDAAAATTGAGAGATTAKAATKAPTAEPGNVSHREELYAGRVHRRVVCMLCMSACHYSLSPTQG